MRLNRKVDLIHLVNPFYLFCISFSIAILVYLWGWSGLYPKLSASLMAFLIISLSLFLFLGKKFSKRDQAGNQKSYNPKLNDFLFTGIIFLGIMNVVLVGYIPIFNRMQNYREFGFPVLDPVFNTLSIFFSVFFLQSYLELRKRRSLAYFLVILIFQVFLFRRSTIVWILASSSLLMLYHFRKVTLGIIIAGFICIPLLSYVFGMYGNYRSSLSKPYVIEDLKSSDTFKKTRLSHHHYITYLYLSSPLANLQENIDKGKGFFNQGRIKDFFFYCIVPESFTTRLESRFNLSRPECYLITPDLIVGSIFMTGYFTLGWAGMVIILVYLLLIILLALRIIRRLNTFRTTALCIVSTTAALLIFDNLLTRLDVLSMILIYPLFFHFIYMKGSIRMDTREKRI